MTPQGRVAGINVAKRTDGELVSFLVPARFAAALLDRARNAAAPSAAELREEIGRQLTTWQASLYKSVTDLELRVSAFGPCQAAESSAPWFSCWARTNGGPGADAARHRQHDRLQQRHAAVHLRRSQRGNDPAEPLALPKRRPERVPVRRLHIAERPIALAGLLASSLYKELAGFAAYSLTSRAIASYQGVAGRILLAVVSFLHLRTISPARLKLKAAGIVTLTVAIMGVQTLSQSEIQKTFGQQAALDGLMPPMLRLAPIKDRGTFVQELEALRQTLK